MKSKAGEIFNNCFNVLVKMVEFHNENLKHYHEMYGIRGYHHLFDKLVEINSEGLPPSIAGSIDLVVNWAKKLSLNDCDFLVFTNPVGLNWVWSVIPKDSRPPEFIHPPYFTNIDYRNMLDKIRDRRERR